MKISMLDSPLAENIKDELTLLYQDDFTSSYTENVMRGDGVVSIVPAPGQVIRFYTPDDIYFGEIHYRKDLDFTIKLPQELIARQVVPSNDFMSLKFDAENPQKDKDYLHVYMNRQLLKIKPDDLEYAYTLWEDYIKSRNIELKHGNLLQVVENEEYTIKEHSDHYMYKVKDIHGEKMTLVPTESGCCEHHKPDDIKEGVVRWRYKNILLINISID